MVVVTTHEPAGERRPGVDGGPTLGIAGSRRFALAFEGALTAAGLSLRALHRELLARGHPVSVATLSYWRTGRSRPEREDSMAALACVEEILRLPAGALAFTLGAKPLRGRAAAQSIDAQARASVVFGPEHSVGRLLASLDLRMDRLERVEQTHSVVYEGPPDRFRWRSRTVWRALEDGVDRFPVVFHSWREPGRVRISPLIMCEIGRLVYHDQDLLTVAEGLFPRTLARGDLMCTAIEYESSPRSWIKLPEVGTANTSGPTTLHLVFRGMPLPDDLVEFRREEFGSPPCDIQPARTSGQEASVTVAHVTTAVVGFAWDLPNTLDVQAQGPHAGRGA